MSKIQFKTELLKINDWVILHLPVEASKELPSRGVMMVEGTINAVPFKALFEPDGVYGAGKSPSHWFAPDKKLLDRWGLRQAMRSEFRWKRRKNGWSRRCRMI